jgi:hypothetical protein
VLKLFNNHLIDMGILDENKALRAALTWELLVLLIPLLEFSVSGFFTLDWLGEFSTS